MKHLIITLISGLWLTACQSSQTPEATYYLVRHAEKVLDVTNPPLTPAGQARAAALALRLEEVKLTQIYSSDYIRTLDTARPTAKAQGVNVTVYDPSDLPRFAQKLKTESGHILIVGHSNTTPPLVGFLDGSPGSPIDEANEYDRFYVVKRFKDKTTTDMQRYGD